MTGTRQRWAIAALITGGVLVVAVVVGLVMSGVWSDSPTPAATSATALPGGSPTAGLGAGDADDTDDAPGAPESPGAEGPRAGDGTPSDGGAPDTSTGLPLPPGSATLVRRPLPPDAATDGAFAPGFPTEVIGLPPQARVVSSSLASEGDRLQAGLVGAGGGSPAAVLEFYRAAFAKLGMGGRESAAAPGSSAMVFALGENTVTVTVGGTAASTEFSVLGVFTAE